jgi:hypothetical protein
MFIERRINPTSNVVELWKCEWENHDGQPAKKVFVGKLSDENSIDLSDNENFNSSPAICW